MAQDPGTTGWRLFDNLAVGILAMVSPHKGWTKEAQASVDTHCFMPLVLFVVQARLRIVAVHEPG